MPARRVHSLPVRVTHWVNAVAITVMIMSGWRIYNASPLLGLEFPAWMTLGDWLLAGNFALYVGYGLVSGHIRRRLLPLRPREIGRDFVAALRFRLPHSDDSYNAVQRLLYVLVGVGIAGAIVSGLAIWKPVQLAPLTALLGGYEVARRVHFLAMAGISLFIVVHLALVVLVPRTLVAMLTGRALHRTGGVRWRA
jgi:thiosulfate reductase cytochrome b subunit